MSTRRLMIPVTIIVDDSTSKVLEVVPAGRLEVAQQAFDRLADHAEGYQELRLQLDERIEDVLEAILALGIQSGYGCPSSDDHVLVGKEAVQQLAEALLNDEDEAGGSGYGITGKAYGLLCDHLLDPLGIKLHVDATDDRFYIGK